MSFKEVASLDADVTTALGGVNKKTGKANPTSIEGYYLGTKTVESKMSKDGTAKLHLLQTEKGNIGVWGKTDLDRKISQVDAGVMIRITQNGKINIPGRNPMYKFKVEVDTENTIEPPAQEATQDDAASESYSSASGTSYGEEDLGEDLLPDEVEVSRPVAPVRAASAPDAARQAKVKELLAKGRASSN